MIINSLPTGIDETLPEIPIEQDRHTLQKRRWRGVAADGTELALDLGEPAGHGVTVAVANGARYVLRQRAEAVLMIRLPARADEAARLGWFFGNQHLPVEVRSDAVVVEDIPTLRETLERHHITCETGEDVFLADPHSKHPGDGHGHHHHHEH